MLLKLLIPLLVGLLLFIVAYASYFFISRKLEQARKKSEAELLTNHTLTQDENREHHQELIKFEKNIKVKNARRQIAPKIILVASFTTLLVSGICIFIFSYEQISKMVYQVYQIATFVTAYSGFYVFIDRSPNLENRQK